ncbi:MAG: ribosome recycling factor [Candidatus Harrisonbacteria bacterium]|nr:ribosome recycling factor [Candidatus Harrisonbacteria bacterium]
MEDYAKDLEKAARPVIESFKSELGGVRANRPNPKLVEDIKVDYMEQQFSIKQLGSISIIPPREINVTVWDQASVNAVAKAIETSGRGLTANVNGSVIRINLPTLTDERRQELTKLVKNLTEQIKIKIRSLRDESNKKIESAFKAKQINEDKKFKSKEQVQKNVDKLNAEIETLLAAKIKEISE